MPAAAPTYTMAPSTFSTSWNLQVESRARWDDDAPLVAAAMDEEKELGLTCDREGVLKLWRWPLSDGRDAQGATRSDPVVELSRAYTPNGKLPLQLVSVPRQGAFLAVFATLVSAADDAEPPGDDDSDDGIVDLSQFAGGEIHAYARDAAGELVHAPLLRTSHGVLTACCVNASLSEVIVASPKRVCSHTLRVLDGDGAGFGDGKYAFDAKVHTFRIPQRLMIKFAVSARAAAAATRRSSRRPRMCYGPSPWSRRRCTAAP